MEKTFRTLFNLLPGEGRKAWLFSAIGFFWSFGVYGFLTLSEGLFIENVGASSLPKVYFFLAASMCLSSGGLFFLLRHLSIRRLLYLVLGTALLAYGALTLFFIQCGVHHPPWVWYLFRMMGTVLPLSIYVCYWAFIDQYYDLQDAKRLFCLYNAVLFLGDACAGATLSFGLKFVEMNTLLLGFMGLIALSFPFIRIIYKRFSPVLELHSEGVDARSEATFAIFFKTILRSKFTLVLMLFYFVMQLLAICTEYNCFALFETAFANKGEHGVTQFLGTCTAWISIGNTIFGLFIYSRLTQRLGVNNITLIAPLSFLVVFILWSFNSVVAIAVLGIIAREGMTYSIDDNNLNLLVSAVPSKVKNQVRISIESFFEPLGTFLSALLLMGLQSQSKVIGLSLALIALVLAFFIKGLYPKALFHNLLATTIHFKKRGRRQLGHPFSKGEQKKGITTLLRILKRGEESEQLLAFESLVHIGSYPLLPRLLHRMDRFSLKGKKEALDILNHSSFGQDPKVLIHLERWKTHLPHSSLQKEIKLHKTRQRHYPCSLDELKTHLQAPCLRTARAFAASLVPLTFEEIAPLVSSLLSELKQCRDPIIRASLLSTLEKAPSALNTQELMEVLAWLTAEEKNRVITLFAKGGTKHVAPLLSMVKDGAELTKNRLFAAKVLGKIAPNLLKKESDTLLRQEIDRVYFYFYHAKAIEHELPALNLSMLKEALYYQGQTCLEFMVVLLGTASSLDMSEVLIHTLASPNKKIRAQTLETLEKIADPKYFKELLSLLTNPTSPKHAHTYLKKGYTPLKLMQLLTTLSNLHSPALKAVVVNIQETLNLPASL